MRTALLAFAVLTAFTVSTARAAEEDASKLYDLTIDATHAVKKGSDGAVTVRITAKKGAEIHRDAPASLILAPSKNISVAKAKLGNNDLKLDGAVASFDAPFTATAAGKGSIDAKLNFVICTETTCARQSKSVTLPVTVR